MSFMGFLNAMSAGHHTCARRKNMDEPIDPYQFVDSDGEKIDESQAKAMQEALDKGKIKYETLPGYRRNRSCVKCGSEKPANTEYHNGLSPTCYAQTGGHEHFLRVCRYCGYYWNEKVNSEEEFAP